MDTVDTRSASVPEDGEKIIEIQLERLRTFKNHPFKIRMDQEMMRLSASVLDYVDKKRLQFTVAVDISYIDKEIQTWLFEYIKENGTVKAVQVLLEFRTAMNSGRRSGLSKFPNLKVGLHFCQKKMD